MKKKRTGKTAKSRAKRQGEYPTEGMDSQGSEVREAPAADYLAPTPPATLADVWASLRRMAELNDAMWAAEERRREEREKAEAKYREAEDKRSEEADKRQKAADKKMAELENLFVGQWGKLIERLVSGDLVRLLRQRGIAIRMISTRCQGCINGKNYEFDIIAHDGDTIVIVEVKTMLHPADVKDFLGEMAHVRECLTEYTGKRILGAVGYLSEAGKAAAMAANKGLFVIRATGGSASITNGDSFKPREF